MAQSKGMLRKCECCGKEEFLFDCSSGSKKLSFFGKMQAAEYSRPLSPWWEMVFISDNEHTAPLFMCDGCKSRISDLVGEMVSMNMAEKKEKEKRNTTVEAIADAKIGRGNDAGLDGDTDFEMVEGF